MEKVLQWLDELRDNLRITRKNNLKVMEEKFRSEVRIGEQSSQNQKGNT